MEIARLTARATSFIRRLQSHPRIFNKFQRVMKDYSTNKLNVRTVVSELEILFQQHPDLLSEYRIFLSPKLRSTLPPPPRQSPNKKCVTKPDLDILRPCINFMNQVQKRFADERGIIVEYMETIRALTQGKICKKEAYNAIVKIFGIENKDLLDGFEFLLWGEKGLKKKKKKEEKKKNSSLQISEQMEDEMFELDINLSHRKTVVDSAKVLMNSLKKEQQETININDYFSAVSLGYIRKEYKEEGDSIITRLREDPRRVLPEILEKLEAKEVVLIKKWCDLHKKKGVEYN